MITVNSNIHNNINIAIDHNTPIVINDLLLVVSVGEINLKSEAIINCYSKKGYIIITNEKGNCVIYNQSEKTFFTDGQVIINSYDNCDLILMGEASIKYCCLSGIIAEKIISSLILYNGNKFDISSITIINKLICDMIENHMYGFRLSELGYSLLIEIARNKNIEKNANYTQLVKNAIDIIQEKYAYIYGIEELSDLLNVNKSHLIRVFSTVVGISPGVFLTKTKIEKSKCLMDSGETNMEIIAEASGFSNANYFAKVFKKYNGTTPTMYLKNVNPNFKPMKNDINKYIYL